MAAPVTWPTRKNEATPSDDERDERQAQFEQARSDREAAPMAIGDMADLLRDTRGSMVTDGCLLGAITIGLALEAGLSARALRPGLASAINLGLLTGILVCWLAAVLLMAWASRPALNAVNELRWRTGAPLDPRPSWVIVPPVGADPAAWTWDRAYLLLGAARLSRSRMRFADTWTYLAGGCFLAWTVIIIVGW
jgi:hypothetical protein